MLVLTRKLMEKVYIGDKICVTVVRLEGGQVRLGIDAPREISVIRAELVDQDRESGRPHRMTSGPNGPEGPPRNGQGHAGPATSEGIGAATGSGTGGSNGNGNGAKAGPIPAPVGFRPQPSSARGSGIRRRGPSR